MVDPSVVESTKDRIVEIVGDRIALHRTGANWTGLCFMHDDTHASLTVSERKKRWRCWVCNEGGDTISFIQRFHGVDFLGALKILGVETDCFRPEQDVRNQQVKEALDAIRRDADLLLKNLEKREDDLAFLSRQVTWLLNSADPLEREASWFQMERWLDAEFEKFEEERQRVYAAAKRHRAEVLNWNRQRV